MAAISFAAMAIRVLRDSPRRERLDGLYRPANESFAPAS